MKRTLLIGSVIVTGSVVSGLSQVLPGAPEENGLTPKAATFYINSRATIWDMVNNGGTESLGVAIANNGNVIVGWEDDGDQLTDLEAVWTIYDSGGGWITPDTGLNSLATPEWGYVTNRFLSYFRADSSAIYPGTAWGPKIKANQFGDGLGMGATSYALSAELTEYAAWDDANSGDAPALQIVGNAGGPGKFLPGVTSAYALRAGDIRIGDWEFLSNGNILIASESRQSQDLIDVYGGAEAATHSIFRILSPTGGVVKAETLASETPIKSEMWHGAAVTANGFAVRFNTPSGATIRMFDNAGNPTSTNINIVEATGFAIAGAGDRGGNIGFHGNGKDAYVLATYGTHPDTFLPAIWVTVFNTNGAVRYSKSVVTDLELAAVGATDAAIDESGNVIVVFHGKYDAANASIIMGRRLDASGTPVGGTFYISEKELPDPATQRCEGPRVAWRNKQVAVVWESENDPYTVDDQGLQAKVVAVRYFSTFAPGSLESLGLTRVVADRPIVVPSVDALGNWEPYSSVLGTSTFLIECNAFAEGFEFPSPDGKQRYVVALQPAAGGAMTLAEGFYSDAGVGYKGEINASRQNGNPGRVAGDTRPGATTYMVGAEISPHVYPDVFGSDNRWNLGFDRLGDGRYGCVQAYKLDTSTMTPTPLMKVQDSACGRLTTGVSASSQMTRYGADVVCLDNGNFASVIEDRSRAFEADSDCVVATIFKPDGTIAKDTWVVTKGDIWANVAPFKGGFAVRAKPTDGTATRVIYFYDNTGTLLGQVDQATSGISFPTGRGDGERLFGHINSPYVYLVGKASSTTIVKIMAFDSRTQKFVAIADVSEGAFTGDFDRANGAVDALNRMTVSWVVKPTGYTSQQVAARVLSFNGTNFTMLTSSFFPFVNVNPTNGIRSVQMSVAMTTRQICIAAKGEINLENKPELGPAMNAGTGAALKEINFFTVFNHPVPATDPTTPVAGAGFTKVQLIPGNPSKLHLEWSGGGGLQARDDLTTGIWEDVVGATSPYDITIDRTKRFMRPKP